MIRQDVSLKEYLDRQSRPPSFSFFSDRLAAFKEQFPFPVLTAGPEDPGRSPPDPLVRFLLTLAGREPAEGEIKEKDPGALEKKFFEHFQTEEFDFAADLLDLGRASYRLRDDDNVSLGKLESQLNKAVREGERRLANRGRIPRGTALESYGTHPGTDRTRLSPRDKGGRSRRGSNQSNADKSPPVDRPAGRTGDRFRPGPGDPGSVRTLSISERGDPGLRRRGPKHDLCRSPGSRNCGKAGRDADSRRHHCPGIRTALRDRHPPGHGPDPPGESVTVDGYLGIVILGENRGKRWTNKRALFHKK